VAKVSTPPDPPLVPPSAGRWYRVWRVARYVVALAAVGIAIWAISGKTAELNGASSYLENIRWEWVVIALAAEVLSYFSYAACQRRLLAAGHIRVPVLPMTGITVAGVAIQNSLPGGVLFYAAYTFRQYRRYGADDVLAGWTLIAVNALSFVCLSMLAAVGLGLALGNGSALDLVEVLLGVAILAVLVVLAWVERARLIPHAARSVRLSQRLIHRPNPRVPAEAVIDGWLARIGTVSPNRSDWTFAATTAMGNWVADCACLAMSFVAVGAGVPWRGLLLAYGAGQLAAILPITPGGLGVVEGSLTVALVTFGGAQDSTVAAVLLYRLISFWLVLPIGWGAWGTLAVLGRNRLPALEASTA
jgi:putative heme transporter